MKLAGRWVVLIFVALYFSSFSFAEEAQELASIHTLGAALSASDPSTAQRDGLLVLNAAMKSKSPLAKKWACYYFVKEWVGTSYFASYETFSAGAIEGIALDTNTDLSVMQYALSILKKAKPYSTLGTQFLAATQSKLQVEVDFQEKKIAAEKASENSKKSSNQSSGR